MDILVFASQKTERIARFEQFAAEKMERAIAATVGSRLPAMETPLGAVYFDQGEPNLLERVADARERVRYLGMSLVVVTTREKPEAQKELRAAGADLLCDPGTPDALIYKELRARCQALEVDADVRRQLTDTLGVAVSQAIQQMTGVELALQSVYRRDVAAPLGDIVTVLELTSAVPGLLVMGFSSHTAQAFARQVFAEVQEDLTPPLVQDCMGEITNVVAGQAKALLHGSTDHFSFSPPMVQSAHNVRLPENLRSVVLAFDSDVGGCVLQRCTAK